MILLKDSTKPSGLIYFGSAASVTLGFQLGGWFWLFVPVFVAAVCFDACRVAIHEKEHNCG